MNMNQSINPRFRAIFNGVPNLERPVQCFGNSSTELAKWADTTLRKYPKHIETSSVTIYERVEVEKHEIRLTTQKSDGSDATLQHAHYTNQSAEMQAEAVKIARQRNSPDESPIK